MTYKLSSGTGSHPPSMCSCLYCVDHPLFVWDEWVSAAEKQMIVNRAGYFPANLKLVLKVNVF